MRNPKIKPNSKVIIIPFFILWCPSHIISVFGVFFVAFNLFFIIAKRLALFDLHTIFKNPKTMTRFTIVVTLVFRFVSITLFTTAIGLLFSELTLRSHEPITVHSIRTKEVFLNQTLSTFIKPLPKHISLFVILLP